MISVIVPVFNEQDNIAPLTHEILDAAKRAPITEIIFVNDASTDQTLTALKACRAENSPGNPCVRIINHGVQSGQSAAMFSGARAAKGPLIVFLDGDGQNDPADIPLLFEAYEVHKAHLGEALLIAGQRMKRQDTALKKLSSRAANALRAFILKDQTRDTGCSLKLMRQCDYVNLPFFNHMHRYIPALMLRNGVALAHVDVSHRPRARGVSKYGFWDRLWAGVFDLIGVAWLLTRARPKNFSTQEIL